MGCVIVSVSVSVILIFISFIPLELNSNQLSVRCLCSWLRGSLRDLVDYLAILLLFLIIVPVGHRIAAPASIRVYVRALGDGIDETGASGLTRGIG